MTDKEISFRPVDLLDPAVKGVQIWEGIDSLNRKIVAVKNSGRTAKEPVCRGCDGTYRDVQACLADQSSSLVDKAISNDEAGCTLKALVNQCARDGMRRVTEVVRDRIRNSSAPSKASTAGFPEDRTCPLGGDESGETGA